MTERDHTTEITLEVDGVDRQVRTAADRLLLEVLREDFDMTGAKLGCGTGDCGACTVLLDGAPVNSCLVFAVECEGASVATPEGVAREANGRLIVEELVRRGGVQCGICTPGFVASAAAALEDFGRAPSRSEVQIALAGNLCRCTGYEPIVEAVLAAADRRDASREQST